MTANSNEYYFVNEVYVTHLSANGIGGWATTTPYPDSGGGQTCVSNGLYVYCIGGLTTNAYYVSINA